MDKFYRINISFTEPEQLSDGLKSQLRRELANNGVYLGIRVNPTTLKRSAAINSLELAHLCMEFAKQALKDYGQVVCTAQSYSCTDIFMKSIIDTDSRMLINHLNNAGFAYSSVLNIADVTKDDAKRSESGA